MKDKRRINKKWIFTNRLGEVYVFGRVGSGKNAYIKTIDFLGIVGNISTTKLEQYKRLDKYVYKEKERRI